MRRVLQRWLAMKWMLSALALLSIACDGAAESGGGAGVRACAGAAAPPTAGACRDAQECGSIGPVRCCSNSTGCWGPEVCPSLCNDRAAHVLCGSDADCTAHPGGKCVPTLQLCPRCEGTACKYPCNPNPDDCGPFDRCQPDGTCAPRRCDDGYSCSGGRCQVGSPRADAHGCEDIPCDDGWTCEENTRCSSPPAKDNHGCVRLHCKADADCDCGFCVDGFCETNLGVCTNAPQ